MFSENITFDHFRHAAWLLNHFRVLEKHTAILARWYVLARWFSSKHLLRGKEAASRQHIIVEHGKDRALGMTTTFVHTGIFPISMKNEVLGSPDNLT